MMIHPSYNELINAVNKDVDPDDEPIVTSRYSIVIGTARRARQLVDGAEPLVETDSKKPLSIAVQEMWDGKVKILGESGEETD